MSTKEDKRFADKAAFGLSQWGGCAIIDFVGDPIIGKHVQDRLAKSHIGQDMHAKKAEVIGDGAAFGLFLATEKFCPGILQGIKRGVQPLLDPVYEKIGNKSLLEWAQRHQVDPKSDAFRAKLDEWKGYQAENFAMASFIAATSVATNVATQVAFGNKRPIPVIAAGKIIGSTVTLGATLAARAFAPRVTYHFDTKVSRYLVQPAIRTTNRLLGAEGSAEMSDDLPFTPATSEATDKSFRTRVAGSKTAEAQYSR